MKALLFCLMAAALIARAEPPVFEREWSFPSGDGSIVIGLTRISRTDPQTYSLTIIAKNLQPDISTEAKCLQSVLADLRQEGGAPEKLWSIFSEFGGADAKTLALATEKSREWNAAAAPQYARVIVRLLNAIDAYEPFDQVLKPYGLSVRVAVAEYISLSSPEALGIKTHSNKDLPTGASIQLATEPAATKP